MVNALALLKKPIGIRKPVGTTQPKKRRPEKPMPDGWFRCVYQGNHVVMNHRPVWCYHAADLVEIRIQSALMEYIQATGNLPTVDELKSIIRNDTTLREEINTIFIQQINRDMHEVDYEIGITSSFDFFRNPKKTEIDGLRNLVTQNKIGAGPILQEFYASDGVYTD